LKETLRMMAAGATGAVLAAAVLAGQPALASAVHAKTAAKNSVTSKSIKNGQVKAKDLDAATNASLAKANTALQSVADNSITSAKISDGSVNSADVADNSLTANDLANNSVGAGELANNAVTGPNVADGGLGLVDISDNEGTVNIDLPNLANNACTTIDINTGQVILGGVVMVSPNFQLPNGLFVESARSQSGAAAHIDAYVCNHSGGALDPGSLPFFWAVLG